MKGKHTVLVGPGSLLLVVGMLALSGCSISSVTGESKPTATVIPTAAKILASAAAVQKTQIKDVEFAMSMNLTANGTPVTGDMTGTETASPNRTDLVITNFKTAGLQFSGEIITDAATNKTYIKITSSSITELPTDQWIETKGGSSLNPLPVDPTQFSNLSQLTDATLKGSEKLDGISVWHLQATKTISGSNALVDIYIRQDNNQLYEVNATVSGTSSGTITFKISGVNTGATISLPPTGQLISAS